MKDVLMPCALKVLFGHQQGKVHPLQKDETIIGRGITCDIKFPDWEISTQHCRLVRVLDDYEIHDMSTNGTFVEGRRLDSSGWILDHGNRIQLSDSVILQFLREEETSVRAVLPPLPTSAAQLYLVIKRPTQSQVQIIPLDRPEIHIGRDAESGVNDVVIGEGEVSRQHAALLKRGNGYVLLDKGSKNGTMLNEQTLVPRQAHALSSGDHIRLGSFVEMWYTSDPRYIETVAATTSPAPALETERTRPQNLSDLLSTDEIAQLKRDNDLENRVMVVFAREDWRALAMPMLRHLLHNQIGLWVDYFYNSESEAWRQNLERAKTHCRAVVAIASEAGIRTPHVLASVRHYALRAKPVLLMRVGNARLPLDMERMAQVSYQPERAEAVFRAIARELSKLV